MKKTALIVAFLAAGLAAPVAPAQAATASAVSPICFLLPLLPDCIAEWEPVVDEAMAEPARVADAPVAIALPEFWGCKPAAAGSGHLLDCAGL